MNAEAHEAAPDGQCGLDPFATWLLASLAEGAKQWRAVHGGDAAATRPGPGARDDGSARHRELLRRCSAAGAFLSWMGKFPCARELLAEARLLAEGRPRR